MQSVCHKCGSLDEETTSMEAEIGYLALLIRLLHSLDNLVAIFCFELIELLFDLMNFRERFVYL